jgi:hypothetical protein
MICNRMTNPLMNIKRCGTCRFAHIISTDISKRICFGAPPAPLPVLKAGPGPMTVQMARPIVHVSEDACSLHQNKEAMDVERDRQDAEAAMHGDQTETRQ